jgi:hypothetical protein
VHGELRADGWQVDIIAGATCPHRRAEVRADCGERATRGSVSGRGGARGKPLGSATHWVAGTRRPSARPAAGRAASRALSRALSRAGRSPLDRSARRRAARLHAVAAAHRLAHQT